jgi:hypothetical protein
VGARVASALERDREDRSPDRVARDPADLVGRRVLRDALSEEDRVRLLDGPIELGPELVGDLPREDQVGR